MIIYHVGAEGAWGEWRADRLAPRLQSRREILAVNCRTADSMYVYISIHSIVQSLDQTRARNVMEKLKALGVAIALDVLLYHVCQFEASH